jgi:2-dehydropantoate 2-reductase
LNGLQIISPHGDVTISPKLVLAGEIGAGFGALLVAVKAFSLEAALDDLAVAVGPETMILPVLNGMRHLNTLAARFGKNSVVGCVCKVATVVDDRGRVVQLTKLQELTYGEMSGDRSWRTDRLDEVMQGAGFDARLSRTIEREMWEKWVLLATLGGITCLMRGNVGKIASAPGGADFSLRFLDEVTAVVTAVGKRPSELFLTDTRALFTEKWSTMTSSMYRDLQKGAQVEAEQIVGDLVAHARRARITTPLLDAAFAHLSIYQNRISEPS